jgi:hypothetical protein
MKVYILHGTTMYDGEKGFGVFSSRKKAERVFDDYMSMTAGDPCKWSFDACIIQEVEVDVAIDFN